jgi:CRP/FNR family cyclic AMP-dependent transcriptional regulator
MDPEGVHQAIAKSEWFSDLPTEAVNRLAAAAEVKSMPINTYVYEQGMPTTEVIGLLSGRVRISISSPNGQVFALIDREAGAWFGEPGLLNDAGRIIDARVIEPARVLLIPRQTVLAVADDFPLIYRNLFRYNQELLRGIHEILAGILFYPLRSRVAGRLHYLLEEHGVPVEGGVLLELKLSQNDFARLAMGSRQRVNKIFRDWSARGLVITQGDRLLVRDVAELEQEIALFD